MGLFTDGFKLLKKASEPLYKTPKSMGYKANKYEHLEGLTAKEQLFIYMKQRALLTDCSVRISLVLCQRKNNI